MSVLIKGMEMPTNCYDCPFIRSSFGGDFYCAKGNGSEDDIKKVYSKRMDDCPLVEIPTPHGDLVDKDKLMQEFIDSDFDHLQRDDWREVNQIVTDAPTVIEAEERGMSKYIVEIKPEYEDSFKGLMILGAKDNDLFVNVLAVDDLELLNSDYINEHFGSLQDTAYQKGLEDGKAQSERGCEGCRYESRTSEEKPCVDCSKNFDNHWMARDLDTLRGMVSGIIDSGYNADDISKILEEMKE